MGWAFWTWDVVAIKFYIFCDDPLAHGLYIQARCIHNIYVQHVYNTCTSYKKTCTARRGATMTLIKHRFLISLIKTVVARPYHIVTLAPAPHWVQWTQNFNINRVNHCSITIRNSRILLDKHYLYYTIFLTPWAFIFNSFNNVPHCARSHYRMIYSIFQPGAFLCQN